MSNLLTAGRSLAGPSNVNFAWMTHFDIRDGVLRWRPTVADIQSEKEKT